MSTLAGCVLGTYTQLKGARMGKGNVQILVMFIVIAASCVKWICRKLNQLIRWYMPYMQQPSRTYVAS